MNKNVLANAGFGEFLAAKIDARVDAIDKWFDKDGNIRTAVDVASAGLGLLTVASEVVAHRLYKKDTLTAKVGGIGLHLVAGASLVATGFGIYSDGYISAEMEAKKPQPVHPARRKI